MSSTQADRTHQMQPTSLDPPESTLQSAARLLCRGGFHLVADPEPPKPKASEADPLDAKLPLSLLNVRASRVPNLFTGISFRHRSWQADRDRVEDALAALPFSQGRFSRFRMCGSGAIVYQHVDDPSRYKVCCTRCHDRFCLPCSQDRARLVVANMRAQIPYEPTRFLTLTLKHTNDPLRQQLDHLYKSFALLRRKKFWKEIVTGGVAFLELKLSSSDDCWHPHLHVLLRGNYLPQKLLADEWLNVTGDSHIVDIRMARDADHLYSYLTRYVTKGWGPGIYRRSDRLVEAVESLHGRKLLLCFGIFANLKLLLPPTTETWKGLGTLYEIVELARRKISWAVDAYAVIFDPDYRPEIVECPPDT